jgi:hypothetical protein
MTALPPPTDTTPGFHWDPATQGRYRRWWDGQAWGAATRPVGGPTLDAAADTDVQQPLADLAPGTRRAIGAIVWGGLALLVGVAALRTVYYEIWAFGGRPGFGEVAFGGLAAAFGLVGIQAGVVGLVVGGLRRHPTVEPETQDALGRD